MNDSVRKHQGAVLFAAVVLGWAHAASVAWPATSIFVFGAPLWWLQLLSLSLFYWVLTSSERPKERVLLAVVYVTVQLSCTFSWLYTAMHTYGDLASWMAVLALISLAAALSVYYGMAAWLHHTTRNASANVQVLAFSAVWTGAEIARGTWLTGFGWGAPGYAHTNGPLAAFAPYIGVYGIGALSVWIAATLSSLHKVPVKSICAICVFFIASIPVQRIDWTEPAGSLAVSLLQGNIAQSEKFEESTGVPEALNWYREKILNSTSTLTVAPETAIPLLPQELPVGYLNNLHEYLRSTGRVLLSGIPLGDYQSGYTNSVMAVGGSQESTYRYDKHHLVPFGEFIPPLFRWFTQMMKIPLGDFNRGDVGQPSFVLQGQRLAPNICYEDLFGEELGARFIDPAASPTIFVNVSNLGWFGGGIVIDQHLQISRMRALEFQRPFVRATNTGATVIMDHRANVTAALPRMTQGVLTGEVLGRTGTTPFAWWISRFGLWPYWVVIVVTVWIALRRRSSP